ncbi:hypothetical protein ZWY2020_019075 [Hordeum vulgare]|nr:hypothetical protein ZWY2020_019075 [Hordeum vulgare]
MAPPPESKQNEAEEACRRAEALFLAGDARAAHRMAQRAQTLCPTLPGVASALAAYAVHAAAANRAAAPTGAPSSASAVRRSTAKGSSSAPV